MQRGLATLARLAAACALAISIGMAKTPTNAVAEEAGSSIKLSTLTATQKTVAGATTLYLVMEGTGLGDKAGDPSDVHDVALGTPSLAFTATALDKSGATRHWLLAAPVDAVAPLAPGNRFLAFAFGGASYVQTYAIEDSAKLFSLKVVQLAAEPSLRPSDGVPLRITATGPVPLILIRPHRSGPP